MRQSKFKSILDGVAIKAGVDPSYIPVHERQAFVEAINDRLTWAWEYAPWPEFLNIEERWFRPKWVGATYERGDEVYHEGTDAYYQALTTTVGIPGTSSDWAPLVDRYNVPEWSEDATYLKGAIFIYEEEVYQCYAQMPSGEAVSFANGGTLPTDANYFLKLPSVYLNRYVAWDQAGYGAIGTPISLFASNPTQNFQRPIKFVQRSEGISPALEDENPGTSVWVEYRSSPPEFTHVAYDAAATYSVGDKVYHEDTGECYEAIASSTGEVPALASTFWSKMQFPAFLAPAVKCLAHAEVLSQEGQQEKMMGMEEKGLLLLVRELDKVESQNDQAKPYAIKPRSRIRTSGSDVAQNNDGTSGSVKEAWIPPSDPFWVFDMGPTIRRLGWNRNGTQELVAVVRVYTSVSAVKAQEQLAVAISGMGLSVSCAFELSGTKTAVAVSGMGLAVSASATKNAVKEASAGGIVVVLCSAAAYNAVKTVAVDSFIGFGVIANGVNPVVYSGVTVFLGYTVSASGKNIVKKASVTSTVNTSLSVVGEAMATVASRAGAGTLSVTSSLGLIKFPKPTLLAIDNWPGAVTLSPGFSEMQYSSGSRLGDILVGEKSHAGGCQWEVVFRVKILAQLRDWGGAGEGAAWWHPMTGSPRKPDGTSYGWSASTPAISASAIIISGSPIPHPSLKEEVDTPTVIRDHTAGQSTTEWSILGYGGLESSFHYTVRILITPAVTTNIDSSTFQIGIQYPPTMSGTHIKGYSGTGNLTQNGLRMGYLESHALTLSDVFAPSIA